MHISTDAWETWRKHDADLQFSLLRQAARCACHSLQWRGAALEAAELVLRVHGDGDDGVVVLVEKEAADDLLATNVQVAQATLCSCNMTATGRPSAKISTNH